LNLLGAEGAVMISESIKELPLLEVFNICNVGFEISCYSYKFYRDKRRKCDFGCDSRT